MVIATLYWSPIIDNIQITYIGLLIGSVCAFASLIGIGTVDE